MYYNCNTCSKPFQTPSSMKAHVKVHRVENTNICRICLKAFVKASSLSRNMLCYKCKHTTIDLQEIQKQNEVVTIEKVSGHEKENGDIYVYLEAGELDLDLEEGEI